MCDPKKETHRCRHKLYVMDPLCELQKLVLYTGYLVWSMQMARQFLPI